MTEIVLTNGAMTLRIDPVNGAEITHIEDALGRNMLFMADWRSPLPLSHGSYGNGVLDWLASYRGGWQELFPNAGGACTVMGTPLPFHGEVSRASWRVDEAGPHTCTLSTGTRLPLVLTRHMHLDPVLPVLRIAEEVQNDSATSVPYIWGHHPAFGPPLTAPGSRIDLSGAQVIVDAGLDGPDVDLMPGSVHDWAAVIDRQGAPLDLAAVPPGPVQRLCYLTALQEGWYAIRNPQAGLGLAMSWDLATFPNLWMWQEIGAEQGMPFYGRGAITALEPASQFPAGGLEAALAAGNARTIAPGRTARTWLTISLFDADNRPVTGVDPDGRIDRAMTKGGVT